MPRAAREKARLVVFQAWFDDSGKGKDQSPVYILGGYSAPIEVWKNFAEEWQEELNQKPRLKWLHAIEAYNLSGQFGFDKKTKTLSEWARVHGRGNEQARDERLVKFAKIAVKYLGRTPDIDSYGLTWMLAHCEYDAMMDNIKRHASALDRRELSRRAKNPYYFSFQKIIGLELKLRVAQAIYKQHAETHILFDEDIDSKGNCEDAFKQLVKSIGEDDARYLNFLENKTAEFRNDKYHMPLQVADLLVWHQRIMCINASRGIREYNDPVWKELRRDESDPTAIKYFDYRYELGDWERITKKVLLDW
jgi:hypothetical protein